MLTTVIAVLGTLAGTLAGGLLQHRQALTASRRQEQMEHRRETLAALSDLVAALDAHRRAMWLREDARLSGASPEAYASLRADSHDTRAAVSAPLVTLSVLAPRLGAPARAAADAAYALRGAADATALAQQRAAAVLAVQRLVDSASEE